MRRLLLSNEEQHLAQHPFTLFEAAAGEEMKIDLASLARRNIFVSKEEKRRVFFLKNTRDRVRASIKNVALWRSRTPSLSL